MTGEQEKKYLELRDFGWEYVCTNEDKTVIMRKFEYIGDARLTNGNGISIDTQGNTKAVIDSERGDYQMEVARDNELDRREG
jgi:hypothetical protein